MKVTTGKEYTRKRKIFPWKQPWAREIVETIDILKSKNKSCESRKDSEVQLSRWKYRRLRIPMEENSK